MFHAGGWPTQFSLDFLRKRAMNSLEKFIRGGNFSKITRDPGVMHYAHLVVLCVLNFLGGERMRKASEMSGGVEALQVFYYLESRKIKLL